MKTRTMYMHTIDGMPATFDPLFRMIYRAGVYRQPRYLQSVRLAASLRAIRREQKQSRASLKAERIVVPRYGYVLVEVPV